jgi:hypothetical protein
VLHLFDYRVENLAAVRLGDDRARSSMGRRPGEEVVVLSRIPKRMAVACLDRLVLGARRRGGARPGRPIGLSSRPAVPRPCLTGRSASCRFTGGCGVRSRSGRRC